MAEGPWRVAARFRVAVLASAGDLAAAAAATRLGLACEAAGMGLADARTVAPGGLGALLQRSAATGTDVLVLEPRTALTAAAIVELRRVAALDPMIAAVLPHFAACAEQDPQGTRPALAYTLLPDRRCTYVKTSALTALAGDGAPGGEDALTATLLGLNRVGFRVAAAGGALALHPDGTSPGTPVVVPPDWRPALARHRQSAPAVAVALIEGLRPGPDGRRTIAFDLSHAGPLHSGTTGLARALVRRAAARWADLALHVVATAETFAAHFVDLGAAVTRSDPRDLRVFSALIRVGQPFLWGEMDAAVRRAPVLLLFMLDTIGLDCHHDAPDELDALWRFCLAEADGLLFNSAFTARQFARRFALRPDMPALASLHSLALADYRLAELPAPPADGSILLIGNTMPHKRLRETAERLAGAALGRPIAALGLQPGDIPAVTALASGGVAPDRMVALYAEARVVVYPSVYEGFGFPILDALAHRRPILVRDLPPYREIAAGLPERANIHHYADDDDLVRRLADPPAWTDERAVLPVRGWDEAADDLRSVLDAALAGTSEARIIRRIDALRGRMSYMRARALGGGSGANDDDIERLASLAGRLVQGAVLWLGRRVPGLRTLIGAAQRGLGRLPLRRRSLSEVGWAGPRNLARFQGEAKQDGVGFPTRSCLGATMRDRASEREREDQAGASDPAPARPRK